MHLHDEMLKTVHIIYDACECDKRQWQQQTTISTMYTILYHRT